MGKIGQTLFGGSKQKSESSSSNRAFDLMQSTYAPQMSTGTRSNDLVASLLGVGGDPAAGAAALDNWNKSTGYDFLMDSGSRAITGNMASKGLLNSGATAKALTTFGQNLASTQFSGYLDKLLGLSEQGMKGGALVSGAGGTSQSRGTGNSKPGMSAFLGQMAAPAAASDPRLKENVYRVGGLPNGLGVYSFNYIGDPKSLTVGVMADEVSRIQPEALGPEVDGFMTVDYDKIEGWGGN